MTRAPLLEQLYLDDNNLEGTLPSVTAEGNGGTGMHLVKFPKPEVVLRAGK